MDEIIKVRRSWLNEIRGLLRAFLSFCDNCLRGSCDCIFSSEMERARMMILEIDRVRNAAEEMFFVENPVEEFHAKIIRAIRQGGGRPVASSSIVIPGESRQRKHDALKLLVKRRRIRRIDIHGKPFYVLNDENGKTNNKQTNKSKGECNGIQH